MAGSEDDDLERDYDDIENEENRKMYSDSDDEKLEEAIDFGLDPSAEGSLDDEEEISKFTINDLEPGMIVNCGAYGDGIIVCSIHDEHRFWGTDDKEEYL